MRTLDNQFIKFTLKIGKKNATNRNLSFELTIEQFTNFIKMNCFYCNSPPDKITVIKRVDNTIMFNYNGIDRKNSKLGYILDNCVPCCWMCNQAKLDKPFDKFINWLEKISSNLLNLKKSIK